jgi:hypothetical protein
MPFDSASRDHADRTALDLALINRLVQESLDREKVYTSLAEKQAKEDRDYFRSLVGWASGAITAIAIAAGLLLWHSVEQFRTDVKEAFNLTLKKSQAEVATSVDQMKQDVNAELNSLRPQIRERISSEFQTENVSKLVRDVAKERTEKQLIEIIRSEVGARVQQNIAPVEARLRTADGLAHVGSLAASAKNDDRKAFDQLREMVEANRFGSDEERRVASYAVTSVGRTRSRGEEPPYYMMRGAIPNTPDEARRMALTDPILTKRQLALSAYFGATKDLDFLVDRIVNDGSIEMTDFAIQMFNRHLRQLNSIDKLPTFRWDQTKELAQWYGQNKAKLK